MKRFTLLTITLFAMALAPLFAAEQAKQPAPPPLPPLQFDPTAKAADGTDLTKADKAFQKTMSGSTMIGSFIVTGRTGPGALRQERYDLRRVYKAKQGYWVFEARVRYGNFDVTVPITVRVEWAGDTPVIQVTDLAIPGLGDAFTARVLVYRNQYAGTWAHGKVGGQMFGQVESAAK